MITRDLLVPFLARNLFSVLQDDGLRPNMKIAFIAGHPTVAKVREDPVGSRLHDTIGRFHCRAQRVAIHNLISRMALAGLPNSYVGELVVIAPAREIDRDLSRLEVPGHAARMGR